MVSPRLVIPIFLQVAVCAVHGAADASWKLEAGGLQIALDSRTGDPAAGGLVVTEGEKGLALKFGPVEAVSHERRALGFSRRESGGKLTVRTEFQPGELQGIKLSFQNSGDRRRLLEVHYALPLSAPKAQWWDGRNLTVPGTDEMQYMRMLLRLPMSVGFGTDQGLAVGLDPHCLLSFFANEAQAMQGGLLVGFRARLVVDPGKTVELPLYAFAFRPRYGHLDAVEKLVQVYPDMFSLLPKVRQNLLVAGGGYLSSSRAARHLQGEEARRFGQGWEWSYCPAQKPGDWYPDERFWDAEIGYAGDTDAHQNVVKGSLDDFRRDMRERFHGGWATAGLAYYLLPYHAEEGYLKSFPGSEIVDGTGQRPMTIANWIKQGSTTRAVYPWGNAYGQELVRELGQIAEDFQPTAIAFDEAYGCDPQYGPGIEGEPGRAWDDKGIFASTQVAMGHLGDEIHRLTVNGYRMATVFNKPWGYQSATRADVAMHEWVPYSNVDSIASLRLLMGTKPLSWWDGFNPQEILRWQKLSPERIREDLHSLVAFIRLSSLRYGAFPPTQQVHGVKSLIELMPVMKELGLEGWQAVPAMRSKEGLWLSRYGRGVRTFLAVGNPHRAATGQPLTLDAEYLGPGVFLFSDYRGAPLPLTNSGSQTELTIGAVPAHGDLVARALVQIVAPSLGDLSGSASCSWEPLAQGTIEAKWSGKGTPAVGEISIAVPRGATPKVLSIGGREVEFETRDGVVRYAGPVPAEGALNLQYEPQVTVSCSAEALAAFTFTSDGASTFQIIVPAGASQAEREVAQRLSAYFEWYQRRKMSPVVPLMQLVKETEATGAPIVEEGKEYPGAKVILRVQDGPTLIALDGENKLILSGRNAGELDAAMLRLLGLLDRQYPFYGALPDVEIYRRAELANQPLL